jgi:hypothetical protein
MLVYSGLENVNEVVTYGTPYLTTHSVINIVERQGNENNKLQNSNNK